MTNQVLLPVGYQLITTEGLEHRTYTFQRPDGSAGPEGYTWKLGCIDAMWCDVRARATALAVPRTSGRELRSNDSYAAGYQAGCQFRDTEIRLILARAGYTYSPDTTSVHMVRKLLIMLNGAR